MTVQDNTVTFYLDGNVDAMVNGSTPGGYTGDRMIGASSIGTLPLAGKLDELLIANTSFSPEEIMNLFRVRSGNFSILANAEDGIELTLFDGLNVTFFADEFEGRKAIERGILNATPLATTFTDSHVHTGDTSNLQQVGRFDVVSQNALQHYAFNYITPGENYTNMNSFDSIIYFSEMINLTGDQIIEQASDFVSARR